MELELSRLNSVLSLFANLSEKIYMYRFALVFVSLLSFVRQKKICCGALWGFGMKGKRGILW